MKEKKPSKVDIAQMVQKLNQQKQNSLRIINENRLLMLSRRINRVRVLFLFFFLCRFCQYSITETISAAIDSIEFETEMGTLVTNVSIWRNQLRCNYAYSWFSVLLQFISISLEKQSIINANDDCQIKKKEIQEIETG